MIRHDVKFTVPGIEKDIVAHSTALVTMHVLFTLNRTISHLKFDWLIRNRVSDTNKYLRFRVNNGDYVINFTSYNMLL